MCSACQNTKSYRLSYHQVYFKMVVRFYFPYLFIFKRTIMPFFSPYVAHEGSQCHTFQLPNILGNFPFQLIALLQGLKRSTKVIFRKLVNTDFEKIVRKQEVLSILEKSPVTEEFIDKVSRLHFVGKQLQERFSAVIS